MALTADKMVAKRGEPITRPLLMKASTTIYKGAGVSILTSTGLAQPAGDDAGTVFMGIAKKQVTSGASGNYYVEAESNFDVLLPTDLTVAQTHMGVKAVVKTDGIVTNAAGATNDIPVGIIVGIGSTGANGDVWVHIEPGAGLGGTA